MPVRPRRPAPAPGSIARRHAAVAAAGVAAVASVVAWRLHGSSYAADVEAICQAEARSGIAMDDDMAGVADWIRANLATPEGNALYSALGDVGLPDRAARLRAEASARGLRSCPLAAAYERLDADGRYRAEVQRLCSSVTFPDLARLPPGARAERLLAWIDGEAPASPRFAALARGLREASTPDERSRALRAASRAAGVLSCDAAKALRAPDPPDAAADAPAEAPPEGRDAR